MNVLLDTDACGHNGSGSCRRQSGKHNIVSLLMAIKTTTVVVVVSNKQRDHIRNKTSRRHPRESAHWHLSTTTIILLYALLFFSLKLRILHVRTCNSKTRGVTIFRLWSPFLFFFPSHSTHSLTSDTLFPCSFRFTYLHSSTDSLTSATGSNQGQGQSQASCRKSSYVFFYFFNVSLNAVSRFTSEFVVLFCSLKLSVARQQLFKRWYCLLFFFGKYILSNPVNDVLPGCPRPSTDFRTSAKRKRESKASRGK